MGPLFSLSFFGGGVEGGEMDGWRLGDSRERIVMLGDVIVHSCVCCFTVFNPLWGGLEVHEFMDRGAG